MNTNDEFEAELQLDQRMRKAVSHIAPDVELALRNVKAAGVAGHARRLSLPNRLVMAAAVLAVVVGGALSVSSLGSDSDEVRVGDDNETTAPPDPTTGSTETTDAVDTTTMEFVGEPLLATEIPAPSDPLTGGDAVRVDWVITESSADDDSFALTEIWADDGRAFVVRDVGGVIEPSDGTTLAAQRDTLGPDRSLDGWRFALLSAGGVDDPESLTTGEQDERIWDAAWDLLASVTLDDEQRAFLYLALEDELGVTYALLPSFSPDRPDTLLVRWTGHPVGADRQVYLNMATGVPQVRFDDAADSSPDVDRIQRAERINVADLDIVLSTDDIEPGATAPAVTLDPDGFMAFDPVSLESGLVEFGTDRATVIDLLTGAIGEPSASFEDTECGRGLTDSAAWGSFSISIDSATDAVVGWSVNSVGPSPVMLTVDGLGLGSTVADVRAARPDLVFEETTLGWEMYGATGSWVMTGPADADTVGAFWAGETCVFR